MRYEVLQTCSLDISQEECLLLCRFNQIIKLCGCAPNTFSKSYASDTFANCTIEKYKTCWPYLGNEDQNCTDKCVPNCEKWYYEFEIKAYYRPHDSEIVHAVQIQILSSSYFILTEEYTYNFELFIGTLGGAIGIWFGLNFVILIGFVFKPIMTLIRQLLSRKGVSLVFFWVGGRGICAYSKNG